MRLLSRLSPRVRKIVDWVVGLALIALGFVGFVLPVLQGWLFVIMGLAVLSSHNRHAKKIYDRLRSMGQSVRDKVNKRRDERRQRRSAAQNGRRSGKAVDASIALPSDKRD